MGLALENRLKTDAQFKEVFKKGKKYVTPYFVSYSLIPSDESTFPAPYPKFGLVASKKVGGAVARNRAKRIMREIIRENMKDMKDKIVGVIILRKEILSAKRDQIESYFKKDWGYFIRS